MKNIYFSHYYSTIWGDFPLNHPIKYQKQYLDFKLVYMIKNLGSATFMTLIKKQGLNMPIK